MNTIGIQGEPARVEFTVTDCDQTGHYGYVYIDDIYIGNDGPNVCSDSSFGYVSIDPVDAVGTPGEDCSLLEVPEVGACKAAPLPNSPVFPIEVCGTYDGPVGGNLDTFVLNIINDGQVVGTLNTPDIDTSNGTFCFTIDEADLTGDVYGEISFEVNGSFAMNCGSPYTYDVGTIGQGFKVCPIAGCPADMFACTEGASTGFAEFDLTEQEAAIKGAMAPADVVVTYYETQADAEAGDETLAIATPGAYTNTTATTQVIYARLDFDYDTLGIDELEDCYDLVSFTLTVSTIPEIAEPVDITEYTLCDDGTGNASFDLTTKEAEIFVGLTMTDYTWDYYTDEADADAGDTTAAITDPTAHTSGGGTIYVRVENVSDACYKVTSFDLVVNPLPTYNAPEMLTECDQGTQDGFTEFDLSEATAQITDGYPDITLSYYEDQTDAESGTGVSLLDAYTNTVMDLQTIYVRIVDDNTGCVDTASLDLNVVPAPEVTAPAPLIVCDANNDGEGTFDLSGLESDITGGVPGVTVSYHGSQSDADNDTGALPLNYDSASATIYARAEDGTGCYNTVEVILTLNPAPDLPTSLSALEECDIDGDGDAPFDLTQMEDDILANETSPAGFTVTYYASEQDVQTNTPITDPTNHENASQTIYVVVDGGANCSSETTFEIIVNPLPAINAPEALIICDDGSANGQAEFDLNDAIAQVTGNDPNLTVSFYETEAEAEAGTPQITAPSAYENEVPYTDTVYVRVEDNTTNCFITAPLPLEVNEAPVANVPAPYVYCDPDNDGFGQFDLSTLDTEISDGVAGVTVTYHETHANAQNDVLDITSPLAFNNTVVDTQTIYARVESPGVDCFVIVDVELVVEPSPQPVLPQDLPALNGCDENGDGIVSFDLTQMEDDIKANEANPDDFTLEYFADPVDIPDNPIDVPAAYASGSRTIYVVVTGSNGCTKQTSFEIIVNDLPAITTPQPLELCDVNNPGDEQEAFNLELATMDISNGDTSIHITYHQTQAEADAGTYPINSPYVNEVNNETIYIRAVDTDTGCSVTQGFTLTLIVNPLPSPEIPDDPLEVCDTDNDGFVEFDLAAQIPIIQNGEPNVTITFHWSPAEANSGANPIDTSVPFGLTSANNQTLYVRATNDLTGCYITKPLELVVVPTPVIGSLEDLYICDDDTPDGFAAFDLTLNTQNILGGQNAADFDITYHISQSDAEAGINKIVVPASYTNTSNPQRIFVRIENKDTHCIDTFDFTDDNSFTLNVEALPIVNDPTPLALCDLDYDTVPVSQVTFDLTVKEGEIAGLPYAPESYVFTYYAGQQDYQNNVPITDPTAYENISNPQTIYITVVDGSTRGLCQDVTTLTITVLPLPSPSETDPDVLRLTACDDDNDGVAAVGFDLTQSGKLISAGENVVLSYYTNRFAAQNGDTNVAEYIIDPTDYTNDPSLNVINDQGMEVQVIYVRVDSGVNGNFCYVIVPIEIQVVPAPVLTPIDPFGYTLCEDGNTGMAEVFPADIAQNLYDASVASPDPSMLVPLLDQNENKDLDLSHYTITYHLSEQDAEDGINAIGSGYVANSGDILYIRVEYDDTGCYNTGAIGKVVLTVEPRPALTEINIIKELCSDAPGGSTTTIDLTQYNAQINPGAPIGTEVIYYADMNAYNNGNPIIATPANYVTVDNPQTIIGVVRNTNTLCESALFARITIKVNESPLVDISGYDGMVICRDSNPLTPVIGGDYEPITIETGLDETLYTFEWSLDGAVLGETRASILVKSPGTYTVTVTDVSSSAMTNCVTTSSATIIESNPPEFRVNIMTESFSEEHTITISNVTGMGDYEFSVDQGPWTSLGDAGTLTFTGIAAGDHIVYGRDKYGCGTTAMDASIIDYPKFMTPNGDGYNDTWNIIGISGQPAAKIYIFDRYGKLLKQLSPTGPGWDGTYNGQPMPSDDYWFRVEYVEPMDGTPRTFKAHFTLKR